VCDVGDRGDVHYAAAEAAEIAAVLQQVYGQQAHAAPSAGRGLTLKVEGQLVAVWLQGGEGGILCDLVYCQFTDQGSAGRSMMELPNGVSSALAPVRTTVDAPYYVLYLCRGLSSSSLAITGILALVICLN
jgi:hypothetical protein